MGKMLKKLIRANRADFALGSGLVGGAFVLTHLITAVVMAWLKPDTSVMLSGGILPVVAGAFILIVTLSNLIVTFSLALRFGQTRRRALGLSLGLTAVEAVSSMLLAGLLAWAERGFAPALWGWLAGADSWVLGRSGVIQAAAPPPGWEGAEVPVGKFFENMAGEWMPLPDNTLLVNVFTLDWYWWLLIFALGLGGGIIIGAVIQRFGSRGLWGLWAAWMAVCILGPHLPAWQEHTILDWMFLPALAVFAAAALVWSVWSLLHTSAKA